MEEQKKSRGKGFGRVFIRGNVWYYRFRHNGMETTKSTGVEADASSPERLEETKVAAIRILDKETEILRLRNKESRLNIVKMMLEDTEEQIRDRLAGIQRSATLSRLWHLFETSSRKSGCSQRQLGAYRNYIHTLASKVGESVRICDIDEGFADTFALWLADGRSANTYNKHLNGYSYIWDAISGRIGITVNPWKTIPRKKLDTVVRRALTDEECDKILASAAGGLKTLIAIGLYTGLRMGDAIHLRWSEIHDGAIFTVTNKTGSQVAIPLHPYLKKELSSIRRNSGEFVIGELREKYDTQGSSSVVRLVKNLFEKCGVKTSVMKDGRNRPLCGFHSLRSTFCTRCTAEGIPQAVVQALVGHASQRMTQHYTHLENKDIIAAFSRIR